MAIVNKTISSYAKAEPVVRTWRRSVLPKAGHELANVVQLRNSALIPPDHLIRHGFPVIPKMVVRSKAVLTADGSYVDDQAYPYEPIFGDEVHARFIAQDNQFDVINNKWTPLTSSGIDYYFTWTDTAPYLEETEYRIGKLRYPMNSVRITEGCALRSSFNAGMDDASSFMIAMAGLINSAELATVVRVGQTMGDTIELSVDEHFYVRNQSGTGKLRLVKHPATMIPIYIVLICDPSRTEIQVSNGTKLISRMLIANQGSGRNLNVVIGESFAESRTLDMNLFEISLFPYAYGGGLSSNQIISAMADVYGSN